MLRDPRRASGGRLRGRHPGTTPVDRPHGEKRPQHAARISPIAIFNIANRCNLKCKGCYAQAIRGDSQDALSPEKLRQIVAEADDLGVSFFVIAGGEPLTRPEIVDIARDFPHVVFLLVTNGLLLDAALIERLKGQRNTVPVLSLEGNQAETDERRGRGVHERLQVKMAELKRQGSSLGSPARNAPQVTVLFMVSMGRL